ncbi:MAG: ribosome-binding factor A [Phycisphaerae bacterium]
MKSESRKHIPRDLCAELHEDDGVDPREAFSRATRRSNRGNDRKTLQLCKQASWTIEVALRCEAADPILNELEVIDVQPAPDSKRLCVFIRPTSQSPERTPHLILERLNLARGFLRAALAVDLSRKRVPELTFEVALPQAESAGDA